MADFVEYVDNIIQDKSNIPSNIANKTPHYNIHHSCPGQQKIIEIVTSIKKNNPRAYYCLHDILDYLDYKCIQNLVGQINFAWSMRKATRSYSEKTSATETLRDIRNHICEIAYKCDLRDDYTDPLLLVILFARISLSYNVMCHDDVEVRRLYMLSENALHAKVSDDWFYPLIENAKTFGLTDEMNKTTVTTVGKFDWAFSLANEINTPWKKFWILVINFYKVDFHSCTIEYAHHDRFREQVDDQPPQKKKKVDPLKEKMQNCSIYCTYNIIPICGGFVEDNCIFKYMARHQTLTSRNKFIIMPIFRGGQTYAEESIRMFEFYNYQDKATFLKATKVIPVTMNSHIWVLIIYPSQEDKEGLIQTVHSIDSNVNTDAHKTRIKEYEIFKDDIVSFVNRYKKSLFGKLVEEKTTTITQNDQEIRCEFIKSDPPLRDFYQIDGSCGVYAHMSILLHDAYDTDDIFLRSVIKLYKDKIGGEQKPIQGQLIFSFYFYCLLQTLNKTNDYVCSGNCKWIKSSTELTYNEMVYDEMLYNETLKNKMPNNEMPN
jgi:hypothetical protein